MLNMVDVLFVLFVCFCFFFLFSFVVVVFLSPCVHCQVEILKAIRDNTGVTNTTLTDMRDMFGDLLGDYHCLDKAIFLQNPLQSPTSPPVTYAPGAGLNLNVLFRVP
jgi:hypothetical protein